MSESGSPAEVRYRISSYSSGEGGNCVAVAVLQNGSVAVRHSKASADVDPLTFTGPEWDAFVAGVRAGEFNRE